MNTIQKLTRPAVLGTLLVVSVAGNLFLGGVLAGRVGARAMHPPAFEREVDARLGFVSWPRRLELRQRLLPPEAEMRRQHREMHALRMTLAEELAREQPRREQLEQALAALREHGLALQQQLHQRFVDTVLELPAAERRAMMDALLQSPRGPEARGRFDGRHHRRPSTDSDAQTTPPAAVPSAGPP
ncbi:MAG TPA: periplasmic heavy metal sensor [Pseudomonadales bacterium]|nr:periplasmic heavy metal sensor [Pseudomonadales bacterium]HNC69144.1 periplasmic heavy metal sensor [Pseudomonadales bacterium]HND13397.1 periplasmic heavy metal sensor [Pseudomonadales bacterium]